MLEGMTRAPRWSKTLGVKLRLFLASAIVSMWVGCQCGPGGLCEQVKCGDGLVCDTGSGKCVVLGSLDGGSNTGDGGGGGGSDGGNPQNVDAGPACPMSCGGETPVCDPVAQKCVTCRVEGAIGSQVHVGCAAPTAFCDTNVPNNQCVGCRTFGDCLSGINMDCDLTTHTCYQYDAGTVPGQGPVQFDDAGLTSRCTDVRPSEPMCRGESCPKGFTCASGVCVLNGRNGPVQVALRFDQPQDLDLYVVEPTPTGGTCEVYYGNPNTPPVTLPIPLPIPQPKPCGLLTLDRDSNRACEIDNVNVENIISPTGVVPTKGTYTVRVNYWQECESRAKVPYEVEVRANGQTRYYCGSFKPSDANAGNQGAGVVITQFTIL